MYSKTLSNLLIITSCYKPKKKKKKAQPQILLTCTQNNTSKIQRNCNIDIKIIPTCTHRQPIHHSNMLGIQDFYMPSLHLYIYSEIYQNISKLAQRITQTSTRTQSI